MKALVEEIRRDKQAWLCPKIWMVVNIDYCKEYDCEMKFKCSAFSKHYEHLVRKSKRKSWLQCFVKLFGRKKL